MSSCGVTRISFSRSRGLYPFDFGIILGLGAHLIIGVLAIFIGRALMGIEKRLKSIEGQG
jgi:hypothetical protein